MAESDPIQEPVADPPAPSATPVEPPAPVSVPGNFDKGLQRLQQKQAESDRKLDEIAALVRTQGGVSTPQQARQQQALQDERDYLRQVMTAPDDKMNPFEAVRRIAARQLQHEEELTQTRQELQQRTSELARAQQVGNERTIRGSFQAEHPAIKDRYNELVEEAKERMAPYVNNPVAWEAAAPFVWKEVCREAEQAAKAAEPPEPASPKPPKSTVGTRVTSPGSPSRPAPRPNTWRASPEEETKLLDRLGFDPTSLA